MSRCWVTLKRHEVTSTAAAPLPPPTPQLLSSPHCDVTRPAETHRLSHLEQAGQTLKVAGVQSPVCGRLAARSGGDGGVRHAVASRSSGNGRKQAYCGQDVESAGHVTERHDDVKVEWINRVVSAETFHDKSMKKKQKVT